MTNKSPRETKQRNAIRKAFEIAGRPLSPKEVLEIASEEVPNLGIATVYRNIKAMVEGNSLAVVELPGQSSRYDLPEANTQHLLLCEETNRVFRADSSNVKVEFPNMKDFEARDCLVIVYGKSKLPATATATA